VIWAWGVAQYPALLPGTPVTLTNAGAPRATLVAIVVLFVILALLIGPSFILLIYLQGRRLLDHSQHGEMLLGTGVADGAPPSAASPSRRAAPRTPETASRAVALGLVVFGALVRALARRRSDR
jgi:hypothetical protein